MCDRYHLCEPEGFEARLALDVEHARLGHRPIWSVLGYPRAAGTTTFCVHVGGVALEIKNKPACWNGFLTEDDILQKQGER